MLVFSDVSELATIFNVHRVLSYCVAQFTVVSRRIVKKSREWLNWFALWLLQHSVWVTPTDDVSRDTELRRSSEAFALLIWVSGLSANQDQEGLTCWFCPYNLRFSCISKQLPRVALFIYLFLHTFYFTFYIRIAPRCKFLRGP